MSQIARFCRNIIPSRISFLFFRLDPFWGRVKILGLRRRIRTKKGKEDNIWERKIFGLSRRNRTEKEREKNIWRRKIFGTGRRIGTEKENICRKKICLMQRKIRKEREK